MRTNRAISTVLDVSLCLLLVSASALTLVGTHPPTSERGTAAETANVLSTSTATVQYSFSGTEAVWNRATRDTLVNLLAAAAVGNAAVRGETVATHGDEFEAGVETAVERALRRHEGNVQVHARWEPYPNAFVAGRTVVGSAPPADATVHAATLTVPSGAPVVKSRAVAAARTNGFAGVAETVAWAVVRGLFPPRETRRALRASPAIKRHVVGEYHRTASATRTTVVTKAGRVRVAETNRRLTAALAPAIERELRAAFDSPTAAARNASVGRVRVTVRTWSA